MSYSKHTWSNDEIITHEKLNNIENGIENIQLTPGPKGERGETGPQGPQGPPGKDASIQKLNAVQALSATDGESLKNAFNGLIADLKAKGYMNNE